MARRNYVIRNGVEARERSRILSESMHQGTQQLFDRFDIGPGMNCLDAACGHGDATCDLARRVTSGGVVGLEVDLTALEMARLKASGQGLENVRFEEADLATHEGERVDVLYARFLLTHLADPAGSLERAKELIRPGGLVILEDIDFTGHFCHPHSTAFWRYVDLYTDAVKKRGGDPNIGPRLPVLLVDAGFKQVEMNVVQPSGIQGEVKLISPMTMENIADAVLDEDLASKVEVEGVIDELYEFARAPRTVLSMPRVVQAWGRLPE